MAEKTILYDPSGNPIQFQRPKPGRAGAVPVARRSLNTSSFTTPEQLKAAWNSARRGDIRTLMQIAEELENDPKIAGLLRQRRLACARLEWQVNPAGTDTKSIEIADTVTKLLRRLKMRKILWHLQDAILKPFAALELIWQNDASKTTIAAVTPRLGTEFNFDFENSGEQLRLVTEVSNPKGTVIDPLKFLVRYSTEKGATIASLGGLFKGIAARYLIKLHLLVNWSIFTERDGQPFRLGIYDPATASDDDISMLKQAVEQLGVDAGAVITKDMEIKIVEGMKNSGRDVFSVFKDELDEEIAVGIVGQLLTSAGSDGGKGTKALGEVHNLIRQELVEWDAVENSEVIDEQLIVPYVIFNYGEQSLGYPTLEILAKPKEDIKAKLDLIKTAQDMGYPVTEEMISVLLDLEEADASDTVLIPQSRRTADAAAQAASLFGAFSKKKL